MKKTRITMNKKLIKEDKNGSLGNSIDEEEKKYEK